MVAGAGNYVISLTFGTLHEGCVNALSLGKIPKIPLLGVVDSRDIPFMFRIRKPQSPPPHECIHWMVSSIAWHGFLSTGPVFSYCAYTVDWCHGYTADSFTATPVAEARVFTLHQLNRDGHHNSVFKCHTSDTLVSINWLFFLFLFLDFKKALS